MVEPAIPLPEYILPPSHTQFTQRAGTISGDRLVYTKKVISHPETPVRWRAAVALAESLGLDISQLGKVSVVAGLVYHTMEGNPIFTLTPKMVVQEPGPRLAAVFRVLFAECKDDRPHLLTLGINTESGEFDGEWRFRRVYHDLRVVGVLDDSVCVCV